MTNIKLITGPMKSGKSEALLNEIIEILEFNSIVNDNRMKRKILFVIFSENREFYTRNSNVDELFNCKKNNENLKIITIDEFAKLTLIELMKFNYFCFDEIQLYTLEQIDGIIELLDISTRLNTNDNFVCSGLLATSEQTIFQSMVKILPYFQEIENKHGVCKCGKDAHFTKYLLGKKKTEILEGDSEYDCVCLSCLNK